MCVCLCRGQTGKAKGKEGNEVGGGIGLRKQLCLVLKKKFNLSFLCTGVRASLREVLKSFVKKKKERKERERERREFED